MAADRVADALAGTEHRRQAATGQSACAPPRDATASRAK
jgi:hypothetical protein